MRVTAIVENTVFKHGLLSEHGLSFLIQSGTDHILFDTGRSSVFMKNLKTIGVAIDEIEACIISHGHSDHTGGLPFLLEQKPQIPVYISDQAHFRKLKNDHDISMPDVEIANPIYVTSENPVIEVCDNVYAIKLLGIYNQQDVAFDAFYTDVDGELSADKFTDEIAVVLHHGKEISVVSGCSHNGATNIMHAAQQIFNLPVKYFIGGLHTKGDVGTERLEFISAYAEQHISTSMAVCHCTGLDSYTFLKEHCGINVSYLSTGDTIEL